MDRVFKSKIGWWYHLLIIVLAVLCVISVLHQNVAAIVTSLVASALTLHVFFNTYYVITADGMLLLRCGFFPKKEIAIADIEALQPSFCLYLVIPYRWTGSLSGKREKCGC